MALRDLSAPAMVAVTRQWLGTYRALLEGQPILEQVLTILEEAHLLVVKTQKETGEVEEQVGELTTRLTAADAIHDRKLRGTYNVLTGAADLVDTPEERAEFLGLRDGLMRDGLVGMQRTYREQGGNAEIAREAFDADAQGLAAQIVIKGVGLDSHIDTWLTTGVEIGEMNAERTALQAGQKDGVSAEQVHQARLAWIKAVNAFLPLLGFTTFDAETLDKLLAELRDAEFKAARAIAAQQAAEAKAARAKAEKEQAEKEKEKADTPAKPADPEAKKKKEEEDEPQPV